MKNVLLLALNTLKVTFRKKSNIVVYLILPVVAILFLMSVTVGDGGSIVKMGIVNKDGGVLSKNMVKYLEETGKFKGISIEEKDISEKVVNKKVDLAIIIPQDFQESIYTNNFKPIRIISIKGEEVTAWVENYTNLYIKNLLDISKASNGDKEIFNKIYNSYENKQLSLKVEKVKDKRYSKGLTQQGFGFFIMFMLIGSTLTSSIILKEKRERVYQRICSTPVSSKVYIMGNIISNVIIITIQVILALVTIRKVLKIDTYIPNYQLFLVLFMFGIVAVGIGMIIVAFSKSTAEAGNVSTLIITPTCMLGGCLWPLSIMPEKVQKISNFIPQKWVIQAIEKLQSGGGLNNIKFNILILAGFALVFFALSAFKMKNTDKTGSFI